MSLKHLFVFGLIPFFYLACSSESPVTEPTEAPEQAKDVHSYAEPLQAKTTHLDLSLDVDFTQQQLTGVARWTIEKAEDAQQIVFDTDDLSIQQVTLGEAAAEEKTTFQLGTDDPIKGMPLTIDLQPNTRFVNIYYSTSPDGAAALDWLAPQQTAGKEHPFLFTQGQAILTRSWIPCQDSPGIRITYEATVNVPQELMAVMSASNPQAKNQEGKYTFSMPQPIPPYLIALAVGDLEFAPLGERTGVYSEPSMIEAAAYEFGDTENMLEAAEDLYGPYAWDRYDIIVLPPSFPFGGMENPRLTFATPTIIAGDRSLTALIAHELAHSWSGNLVTNATWDDFWLNEGFTVYFERRIMEALYGKDYTDMLAILGYQDLEADVNDLGPESEDTHLHLSLEGRDPDDGMTDVAYEKGAFFLQLLEEKAGRETFDAFLKEYFETHKFQTLTTEEFIVYLREKLLDPNQLEVDIDEWIYGPGIPASCPVVKSERFELVDKAVQSIAEGNSPQTLPTGEWTSHEWLHFIRHLPKDLSREQMTSLDEAFGFTQSGNSELQAAWLELSIRNGYGETILSTTEDFLTRIGRRKFLYPIYRALKESDQLDTARSIFTKAAPNYHEVSRKSIATLLEVES
jgi:leukotriene-A4 hydrolase